MQKRQLKEGIYWLGAVDWDRRLFDSLIPLPDGTMYNAYLVGGSRLIQRSHRHRETGSAGTTIEGG